METGVSIPTPPRRVALFITCLVDVMRPQVGLATVEVLERLGITVTVPPGQTCCGQPAYNAGLWEQARPVARRWLELFADAPAIVAPSGSCVAMIRRHFPVLFGQDPELAALAGSVAARTWEFSQFLVDVLGVTDVGARFEGTLAVHDCCHALRELNVAHQPRLLLQHVAGARLGSLEGHDECCGFGGLFAVDMPEISAAMLDRKVRYIRAADADAIVVVDVGCQLHMLGGLRRQGVHRPVYHLAEVLAGHTQQV